MCFGKVVMFNGHALLYFTPRPSTNMFLYFVHWVNIRDNYIRPLCNAKTGRLSAITNLIQCSLIFQMIWSNFFEFAKFFFYVVNLTNCLKLLVETSPTSIPLSIKYLIHGFASIWYDVSLKVIHFRDKNVFH